MKKKLTWSEMLKADPWADLNAQIRSVNDHEMDAWRHAMAPWHIDDGSFPAYFSDALRYSMSPISKMDTGATDSDDIYKTIEELEKALETRCKDGNCSNCDGNCKKAAIDEDDIEFKPPWWESKEKEKQVDGECHCVQLLKGHEKGCRYYRD